VGRADHRQRIVARQARARRARVAFEVPRGRAAGASLSSVLEVVYLVFNEGYAATAGDDLMRPALVDEALRLGRLLAISPPAEPEVLGLHALMQLQASRAPARTGATGEPVLCPIKIAAAGTARGWWRAGSPRSRAPRPLGGAAGPYRLQASIAACHGIARSVADTDWRRIAALYGDLARAVPSPVWS